jgi:hypothetical protein
MGAVPYWDDLKQGQAWSMASKKDRKGQPITNATSVLRDELRRVGIAWRNVRATNFWLHGEPDPNDDLYDEEFKHHYKLFKQEIKNKKAMLMVGRQIMPMLFEDRTVTELEYMNLTSKHFPKGLEVCIIAKHPSIVLTKGATAGDVRFAIEKFANLSYEYRRE